MNLSYDLTFLMAAKKSWGKYLITMDEKEVKDNNPLLGKLKSNLFGSKHFIYDSRVSLESKNILSELGVALYVIFIQKTCNENLKKIPRKVKVIIPSVGLNCESYVWKSANVKNT